MRSQRICSFGSGTDDRDATRRLCRRLLGPHSALVSGNCAAHRSSLTRASPIGLRGFHGPVAKNIAFYGYLSNALEAVSEKAEVLITDADFSKLLNMATTHICGFFQQGDGFPETVASTTFGAEISLPPAVDFGKVASVATWSPAPRCLERDCAADDRGVRSDWNMSRRGLALLGSPVVASKWNNDFSSAKTSSCNDLPGSSSSLPFSGIETDVEGEGGKSQ
ncbi:hypothetical protein CSOJ01_14354 [Colletotrichum sojae]|uniref:Uncharacterized protein n=1 Tax=Colletotrichum sojae TaxID=2175907 RepID=A0A8H6IQT9_9PEZI|nr:hypothetical protein CSOJ01_14354 [Colletotrichum sojae]